MKMNVEEHLRTLFLGDLSWFCQENDVFDAFSPNGEIEDIRLIRSKENKCLGYGFVTFKTPQDAYNAMTMMNGKVLVGRKLNIKWASKRAEQDMIKPARVPKPNIQNAQLHFSFISKQANYIVTEATIRDLFQQFGEVEDICMKKSAVDKRGEQTGYGFIRFPMNAVGLKSALHASTVVRQIMVDEVLFDCCLTHVVEDFLMQTATDHTSSVAHTSMNADAKPFESGRFHQTPYRRDVDVKMAGGGGGGMAPPSRHSNAAPPLYKGNSFGSEPSFRSTASSNSSWSTPSMPAGMLTPSNANPVPGNRGVEWNTSFLKPDQPPIQQRYNPSSAQPSSYGNAYSGAGGYTIEAPPQAYGAPGFKSSPTSMRPDFPLNTYSQMPSSHQNPSYENDYFGSGFDDANAANRFQQSQPVQSNRQYLGEPQLPLNQNRFDYSNESAGDSSDNIRSNFGNFFPSTSPSNSTTHSH